MLPSYRGGPTTNMTHRSQGSGSYGQNNRDQKIDDVNRSLLEQENDRKWAQLGNDVEMLKMLTMEINTEVKSQNSLLDGMGVSFNSANQLFGTTIGKLGQMLSSGSSKHMIYLICFIVFVFLVVYYLMRK